jgi:CBS domain-containing protein
MHTLQQIVDSKSHQVHATLPTAMVIDAVGRMCLLHVRALLVGELTRPLGIVAERDVLERIVLRNLDATTTPVEAVMTTPLISLPAESTASMALEFLREHRLHQVPIVSGDTVVGVVSSTELMRWAAHAHEYEIRSLTDYFSGRYPG